MYQPRIYRRDINHERFDFFRVVHFDSDLLVGIPRTHTDRIAGTRALNPAECVLKELKRLRKLLLDYALKEARFTASLEPFAPKADHGPEIGEMLDCGRVSSTGPMAAVAGLFASRAAQVLLEAFSFPEVLVENGGDLFLKIQEEARIGIHAGNSPLSDKMAFVIPKGSWGICTSSGTLGPSFSKGRADAVCVICKSAPLADSWATSLANRVQGPSDIEQVLEIAEAQTEILGCAIIIGERIGIRGIFSIQPIHGKNE